MHIHRRSSFFFLTVKVGLGVLVAVCVFASGYYWRAPEHAPSDGQRGPERLFGTDAPATDLRPGPDVLESKSTVLENTQADPEQGIHKAAPSPEAEESAPAASGKGRPLPFAPAEAPFILHKLGTGQGPTLLIVGGIQGDEPGGFSAAALVASHYSITAGSVWVVPNLNFPSILQRHRGIFGDMNRKFATLDPKDPEYATVSRIKSTLLDDKVSLILNLHDGSGFYRPVWEDSLRNPKRWGQSVIIDQEEMPEDAAQNLYQTAREIEAEVNKALLDPGHRYHIHNTLTAQGNTEMAKTLSWFAVCNGKPAFGIEASKEFSTEHRAYYHLQVVEAFMRRMGIGFERDFALSPKGVLAALNSNLKVAAYDSKVILDLDNARPSLNMVPFRRGTEPDVRATKPLLTLVPDKKGNDWRVAYGNRTLTRLIPEFMDFDDSLDSLEIMLDGKLQTVRPGDIVSVQDSFLVKAVAGYRVNAIGAQREVNGTEAGVSLSRKDFMPRFSVDKSATTYRVEVYKDKAFAGMVLVRFGAEPALSKEPLTATGGKESDLGF